ncbi:MAG: hypothetical protein WC180_02200 [Candidatus Paceibacterota bacterium]
METEKKPEEKAKNKKKIAIIAAVVVVGGAVAVLSSSKSSDLLSFFSGDKNSSGAVESQTDIKRPDREADIVGFVESIKGNEVTILKMDMSQMPGADRTGSGSDASDAGDSDTEAKVSLGQDSGTGMQRPEGGQGGGPENKSGSDATGDTSARAEMMAELKKNSTGTEVVTIPVGILMSKRDTTAQKDSASSGSKTRGDVAEVEASLSDIVVDQMVTIWLNQDVTDRNVAEFVSITG